MPTPSPPCSCRICTSTTSVGYPQLILDGQFRRRTAPLTVAGPQGLAARLTDAMEVMFPGSSTVRRRFGVHVIELDPADPPRVIGSVTVQAGRPRYCGRPVPRAARRASA